MVNQGILFNDRYPDFLGLERSKGNKSLVKTKALIYNTNEL